MASIDGELPLNYWSKESWRKSVVPDGDFFVLMPNDTIAVATNGLSSFEFHFHFWS